MRVSRAFVQPSVRGFSNAGSGGSSETVNYAGVFGGTAFIRADSILTPLAGLTVGAIEFRAKTTADSNQQAVFNFGNDSTASLTRLVAMFDMRSGAKELLVEVRTDAGVRWQWFAPDDSISPDTYYTIKVTHNGTVPTVTIDGAELGSVSGGTQTAWFKAAITDAANPADTFSMGVEERNGANIIPLTGAIDWLRVYSDAAATTLVADYQFGEGAGATVADSAGSYDGTATNMTWGEV